MAVVTYGLGKKGTTKGNLVSFGYGRFSLPILLPICMHALLENLYIMTLGFEDC